MSATCARPCHRDAAFRRLGTFRHAIAADLPRTAAPCRRRGRTDPRRGAAQILLLDVPGSRRRRRRRGDRQGRSRARRRCGPRQCRAAQDRRGGRRLLSRPIPSHDTPLGSPNAGSRPLRRETTRRHRGANGESRPSTSPSRPTRRSGRSGSMAWCCRTGSIRLNGHAAIPTLPGYAEGHWWVQDAAAALPAQASRRQAGRRVADLCAAPGGKTAQLAAAGADVLAVDRSPQRLKRLNANMARLGLAARRATPTRLSSRRRPSMPSCSMRPARRPALFAATPMWPGPRPPRT